MEFTEYEVEDFVCDQTFQQYCLGSSPQAIVFWENWIVSNPSRNTEAEEAKQMIALLSARQGYLPDSIAQLRDGIERLDLLRQVLRNKPASASPVKSQEHLASSAIQDHRRSNVWKYIGIAASLLLFTGAGWYLSSPKQNTNHGQVISLESTSITSGNVHRKTVVLSDGSIVTLHKNSTIILSSSFDKSNRDITLTGEAFFDVARKSIPFIVHTTDMNVEVLGTAFNVSAYPQRPVETALFRGKIVVSLNNSPSQQRIILLPNEKFVLNLRQPQNTSTVKNKEYSVVPVSVDSADHKPREIAWLRSQLKIEDESLETIAGKLQQWYGIQISFADDQVKTYRYSGTFENETVMKALEALQLSYPFNFKVEDNRIIISK
jgi:transmembrane sensor